LIEINTKRIGKISHHVPRDWGRMGVNGFVLSVLAANCRCILQGTDCGCAQPCAAAAEGVNLANTLERRTAVKASVWWCIHASQNSTRLSAGIT
jgi:hypothetical protein